MRKYLIIWQNKNNDYYQVHHTYDKAVLEVEAIAVNPLNSNVKIVEMEDINTWEIKRIPPITVIKVQKEVDDKSK
jgi:hypothetical protein